MTARRRLLGIAACASLGALVWTGTTAGASSGQSVMKQLLPKHGAKPGGGGGGGRHVNYLTYHGGPVQIGTIVYLVYWGSSWGSGFSTGGYSSSQAQTYLHDFFNGVGGSQWIATDNQYCQGVASGTVNCGSSGQHVTNSAAELAGTWTDSTSNPPANKQIQDSDIAAEAVRAVSHFGYNANATYLVFTPSGDSESGFAANGGSWCAWHSDTSSGSGTVNYGYIPYQPDAGASCGVDFINSNDSYGNGYFDGFSVVAGHEYEEAQTDPHLNAWYDRNGSEDADKCAWNSLSADITIGTHVYAVQPVWSNTNNGCVAPQS